MEYILPQDFKSKIKYNLDMSAITWFQTGGKANVYCHVYNDKDLKVILKQTPIEIPIFVLGAGSNVLVRDKGFRGIVIKLGKNFNRITLENNKLIVGASVLDNNLSKFALKTFCTSSASVPAPIATPTFTGMNFGLVISI